MEIIESGDLRKYIKNFNNKQIKKINICLTIIIKIVSKLGMEYIKLLEKVIFS